MDKVRIYFKMLSRNLYPRIMTLILVVFVPISAILILFSLSTLSRFSEQINDRAHHELELCMDHLETNVLRVENYANEFANRYLDEISSEAGFDNVITPYDMIGDLDRWFSGAELTGFTYVYVKNDGRCYTSYSGAALDPGELEQLRGAVAELAAEDEMIHFQIVTLGERKYLFQNYAYRNCHIGFLIDAVENINASLRSMHENSFTAWVADNQCIYYLTQDGYTEDTQTEIESLRRGSFFDRTVVWDPDHLPITVGVSFDRFRVFSQLPMAELLLPLAALLCLLFFPLIHWVLRKEIFEPIDILLEALDHMGKGDAEYRICEHSLRYSDEILELFDAFNSSADETKRSGERKLQLVRTELDNLRLQVNPHMLLNSFNLIFALAQSKDFERIQDYTYLLVRYFRYVLRKNDDFVPLAQEIEFIRNYVDIQSIRYPGAFLFSYNVQPSCESALIPPLLVENFVENSMKHALSPGKTVDILMDIKREGEHVLIAVSDAGNGIAPDILEKLQSGEPYVDPAGNKHIGIWNSMRRVELFYGEKASLEIVSAPEQGTSVILKIPYREAQNDEAADRG